MLRSRARVELGLAGLELLAGADELGLLGGDRVAGRADALDGRGGVVAKLADAADDVGVAVLDPLQVLVAAEGVVDAVGLEDDRDRARIVGLVDVDEPVLEGLDGPVEALAEDPQVVLLGVELGLGLVELLLDGGLAGPQGRDLAGELVDLVVVAGDLGRQDALLLLRLIELGLLGVELASSGPRRGRARPARGRPRGRRGRRR